MDTLEKAHEYAKIMLEEHLKGHSKYNDGDYLDGIARDAVYLAKALHAENIKCEEQAIIQLDERANTVATKEVLDLMDFVRQAWDHAPTWANYLATDPSGESYWYESKPRSTETGWVGGYGRCQSSLMLGWYHNPSDFQKLLHQRPN